MVRGRTAGSDGQLTTSGGSRTQPCTDRVGHASSRNPGADCVVQRQRDVLAIVCRPIPATADTIPNVVGLTCPCEGDLGDQSLESLVATLSDSIPRHQLPPETTFEAIRTLLLSLIQTFPTERIPIRAAIKPKP